MSQIEGKIVEILVLASPSEEVSKVMMEKNLAESVAKTVAAKEGEIKAACIEVANIVNDWRTEIVGGLDADGAIKRKKCFLSGEVLLRPKWRSWWC